MKPVRVMIAPTQGAGPTKAVRDATLTQVETYTIESAIDTDSDTWSIDIGDPAHELIALLRRDVEIAVSLMGGEETGTFLKTGFTDTAGFTEAGTLALSGRDVSSLATDSTHPPGDWRNMRPDKRIAKEAAELGIKNTRLAKTDVLGKAYTDGSETYWEFWYRLARKKKMWLWCEPDGKLIMDELNYGDAPKYFFGKPNDQFQEGKNGDWLGVKVLEIKKNTQTRVGEIFYFGEDGRKPFYYTTVDTSIRKWIRRPIRVIFDSDVRSQKQAKEAAWEEIFEGKVGSVEIVITVADPGYIIRQNNMAALSVPELGITGVYFITGVTVAGGPGEGFTQTIRLREKNFALSRRVPDDPELAKDPSSQTTAFEVGSFAIARPDWSDYYWRAAQKHHGGYAVDQFAAVIMGITMHETGMRNVREGTNPYYHPVESCPSGINNGEWFPWNSDTARRYNVSEQRWRNFWANSAGHPPGEREGGVGPGQLTTLSLKQKADALGGKKGEYDGARWEPEWNIMVVAELMAFHLKGKPVSDASISDALHSYAGRGSPYAQDLIDYVWDYVKKTLPNIQETVAAATQLTTAPGGFIAGMEGAPAGVRNAIIVARRQLGKPYVWGAEGPDTFDCSGLCYYAYREGGGAPSWWYRGTTYSWWGDSRLKRVPDNQALPGDLVFFGGSDVHHMGMNLGGGQFIQAPQTGDVVKITPLNSRDDRNGFKRVIPWG